MLYAEYKGAEVWASEFPPELANLNTCKDGLEHYPKCPDCYKRVTHRSQSSDGRSANFAHCGWSASGGKGGGNACSGATVGESQEHKAMKDIAASAVGFALDDVGVEKTCLEVELAANYSDADWRTADCVIEFETRDEQLGEGLIIEVQHQNKAKDKEKVTLDYLNINQEYSVLWLSQQDFETDADHPKDWWCRVIDEATVRRRVRQQLWPIGEVQSIWSDRAYSEEWSESPQIGLLSSANTSSEKTAKDHIETVRGFYRRKDDLPKPKLAGTAVDAIADEYRHSHKNSHGWQSLFRAEHAQQYIEEVDANE